MTELTNQLDRHIAQVMQEIQDAAAKRDLPAIQRHTHKATELEELKKAMENIRQRFASLTSPNTVAPVPAPGQVRHAGLRRLPIEVTDGNIRQNLLTLTPHVKSGELKVGEVLIIQLPSGERFRTDVVLQGNKLRERGKIASFYRDAKVKGGDYVLLTEVEPGSWTLTKDLLGEFSLSRQLRYV